MMTDCCRFTIRTYMDEKLLLNFKDFADLREFWRFTYKYNDSRLPDIVKASFTKTSRQNKLLYSQQSTPAVSTNIQHFHEPSHVPHLRFSKRSSFLRWENLDFIKENLGNILLWTKKENKERKRSNGDYSNLNKTLNKMRRIFAGTHIQFRNSLRHVDKCKSKWSTL